MNLWRKCSSSCLCPSVSHFGLSPRWLGKWWRCSDACSLPVCSPCPLPQWEAKGKYSWPRLQRPLWWSGAGDSETSSEPDWHGPSQKWRFDPHRQASYCLPWNRLFGKWDRWCVPKLQCFWLLPFGWGGWGTSAEPQRSIGYSHACDVGSHQLWSLDLIEGERHKIAECKRKQGWRTRGPRPYQFSEQQLQVRFQQTHNSDSRQLFFSCSVSWDLHCPSVAHHTWQCPCFSVVP